MLWFWKLLLAKKRKKEKQLHNRQQWEQTWIPSLLMYFLLCLVCANAFCEAPFVFWETTCSNLVIGFLSNVLSSHWDVVFWKCIVPSTPFLPSGQHGKQKEFNLGKHFWGKTCQMHLCIFKKEKKTFLGLRRSNTRGRLSLTNMRLFEVFFRPLRCCFQCRTRFPVFCSAEVRPNMCYNIHNDYKYP